jgi:hypothetical protein
MSIPATCHTHPSFVLKHDLPIDPPAKATVDSTVDQPSPRPGLGDRPDRTDGTGRRNGSMKTRLLLGGVGSVLLFAWSGLGPVPETQAQPPEKSAPTRTGQPAVGTPRADEAKPPARTPLQAQLDALDVQKRHLDEQAREQVRQLEDQVREQVDQAKGELAGQVGQLQRQARRQVEQTRSAAKRQGELRWRGSGRRQEFGRPRRPGVRRLEPALGESRGSLPEIWRRLAVVGARPTRRANLRPLDPGARPPQPQGRVPLIPRTGRPFPRRRPRYVRIAGYSPLSPTSQTRSAGGSDCCTLGVRQTASRIAAFFGTFSLHAR